MDHHGRSVRGSRAPGRPGYLSRMFGCLRRLGCLLLLVVLGAAGYWYWTTHADRARPVAAPGVWHRVAASDGSAAAQQLRALQAPGGKVFANLTPAEAVAYLLVRGGRGIPASAQDVQATVRGDTLRARALVSLRDLGGGRALGPIAALVSARDTVQLAGTVRVLRPGMAEFRVTEVRLRNLDVPRGAIPNLVQQLRHGSDPALDPNGIALPLPPDIGDIRIANGKITLYKTVSP